MGHPDIARSRSLRSGLRQSPWCGTLAKLEGEDARQQGQADDIGNDNDDIGFQKPVNDPKRHAEAKRQEHLQREIACGTRLPAFLELRIIRSRRAERCEQANDRGEIQGEGSPQS